MILLDQPIKTTDRQPDSPTRWIIDSLPSEMASYKALR
jgi:hypothetical protein